MTQRSKFHMLFVKQLRQYLNQKQIDFITMIKDMQKQYPGINNEAIIIEIIEKLKEDPKINGYIEAIKNKVTDKSAQLYEYQSRKNTFMIDCLREATSFPCIKEAQQKQYNFRAIYKKTINKQLRRLIWSKCLITQKQKKQFYSLDHLITPYNLEQQLIILCVRTAQKDKIILKENQKDLAIRILEYKIKKQQKLPYKNQLFLVFSIVQLFSFYTVKNSLEMGSVYLSLLNLSEKYFVKDLDDRFKYIFIALQLIDNQLFLLLNDKYFKGNTQAPPYDELNQAFQSFRLSFGGVYLPLNASQFLVDQLLIKKFVFLDMYVYFAMMLMILTDQFQKQKDNPIQFKEILSRAKTFIKLVDIVDVFNVCYEKIPVTWGIVDTSKQEKNNLYYEMVKMQHENILRLQQQQNIPVQQSEIDQDKFIYNSNKKFRLGEQQF